MWPDILHTLDHHCALSCRTHTSRHALNLSHPCISQPHPPRCRQTSWTRLITTAHSPVAHTHPGCLILSEACKLSKQHVLLESPVVRLLLFLPPPPAPRTLLPVPCLSPKNFLIIPHHRHRQPTFTNITTVAITVRTLFTQSGHCPPSRPPAEPSLRRVANHSTIPYLSSSLSATLFPSSPFVHNSPRFPRAFVLALSLCGYRATAKQAPCP